VDQTTEDGGAFSLARRKTSFLIAGRVEGRAVGRRWVVWFHLAAMNRRCQPSNVAGVTGKTLC